jgi:hypothetical protein
MMCVKHPNFALWNDASERGHFSPQTERCSRWFAAFLAGELHRRTREAVLEKDLRPKPNNRCSKTDNRCSKTDHRCFRNR